MPATDVAMVVRPAKAAELLGIGVSTLWRYTKEVEDFPKPVRINSRVSVFVREELDNWVTNRIASARKAS
ncbi:prophage CP4-57 regulatory protein (AlpA) [Burkholderia pseudomallei]|nr:MULTISPECIES: AlpA family phage regulatory protein [Burkholderia]AIP48552.1 prophage CP4-57 regulatory family protein [Burkholderia pseudomallei MSHR5858]MCQ8222497.1 AlpA family phage regulatory protein [Burkholderia pseudomallei]MCW0096661.1 AlpA family phage regulatory protein [Burkholderia pseudomallei]MDV2106013.1 AlpA family phage regulatory protein [Burkholderia pseudomallei]MDV2150854.1 AlpA family phage regulatory protein [Burkholderia pseudomallei]